MRMGIYISLFLAGWCLSAIMPQDGLYFFGFGVGCVVQLLAVIIEGDIL